MKKIAAALLAALMIVTVMSGCSNPFNSLLKNVIKNSQNDSDETTNSHFVSESSQIEIPSYEEESSMDEEPSLDLPESSEPTVDLDEKYVGVWRTVSVSYSTQTFTIEEFEELTDKETADQVNLTITLNADGTCKVQNATEASGAIGNWSVLNGEISIEDDFSSITLTEQEDGSLLLEENGVFFTFKK